MALIQVTCYNTECPGFSEDEDGIATGHTFLATEVPAAPDCPSYLEGTCPKCEEDIVEWRDDVETLSKEDIQYMRLANGPDGHYL